jgi:cellobiose phosphorylase
MYRINVEGVLGLKRQGNQLIVSPCVPKTWKEFQVAYRNWDGSTLLIRFENPEGVCSGVASMMLDGKLVRTAGVLLPQGGATQHLLVTLGAAQKTTAAADKPSAAAGNGASGASKASNDRRALRTKA